MGHKKVLKLVFVIICVAAFIINFNININLNNKNKNTLLTGLKTNSVNSNSVVLSLNQRIFNYMNKSVNRTSAMRTSHVLNDGDYENGCVFFVSEVLRQLDVDLSKEVSNTYQLMYQLNIRGWKRYNNYKELIPGDICFTTSDNSGYPTHSFIFMRWEKKDSYDYAYIVDNQENRYGFVYHLRNISKPDVYQGINNEAFAFFLRK